MEEIVEGFRDESVTRIRVHPAAAPYNCTEVDWPRRGVLLANRTLTFECLRRPDGTAADINVREARGP